MTAKTIRDAMFDAADELRDIEGLKTRRPDHAAPALLRIVWKLRNETPLTDRERCYLADAIECAITDPRKAGAALGLVQKKARGIVTQQVVDEVAADVWHARFFEHMPLTPNRETIGAFAAVAERKGMTEKKVEDYYYKASPRYRFPPEDV